jgi:hypothetical protein
MKLSPYFVPARRTGYDEETKSKVDWIHVMVEDGIGPIRDYHCYFDRTGKLVRIDGPNGTMSGAWSHAIVKRHWSIFEEAIAWLNGHPDEISSNDLDALDAGILESKRIGSAQGLSVA